ncbi:MAG: histidine phosphatase family protein [Rhizobiaceae bacterium]|nr:histidine phosphatase family protein [Rhizobiaceae bacterium]
MHRLLAALFLLVLTSAAGATEAGWALLRDGGHVVLLRHANAPGTGEPANFDIAKCATQRNLSDRGRQQAKRIGALFAARAAPVEKVLTSSYCRCADTARLAFGDALTEIDGRLDFLPGDAEGNEEKALALIEFIRSYTDSANLVMVLNEDVAQRLVGVAPREAEALIVARGGETLKVAGRIRFN